MLHKNAKDRFNFEDCRFTVTRDKEGTGRIVFKNMGILNSYTLEASYGGSNCGNKAYSHFTPRDYENVGRYFCETLLDFNDPSPPKEQLRYKVELSMNLCKISWCSEKAPKALAGAFSGHSESSRRFIDSSTKDPAAAAAGQVLGHGAAQREPVRVLEHLQLRVRLHHRARGADRQHRHLPLPQREEDHQEEAPEEADQVLDIHNEDWRWRRGFQTCGGIFLLQQQLRIRGPRIRSEC